MKHKERKGPKWSYQWLTNATDAELTKALAQAESNSAYLGDRNNRGAAYWKWERNAKLVKDEINRRNAPELLNELKEVLSWALTEKAPLRQQEIDSINAVIAKAEGGL